MIVRCRCIYDVHLHNPQYHIEAEVSRERMRQQVEMPMSGQYIWASSSLSAVLLGELTDGTFSPDS